MRLRILCVLSPDLLPGGSLGLSSQLPPGLARSSFPFWGAGRPPSSVGQALGVESENHSPCSPPRGSTLVCFLWTLWLQVHIKPTIYLSSSLSRREAETGSAWGFVSLWAQSRQHHWLEVCPSRLELLSPLAESWLGLCERVPPLLQDERVW